MTILKTGTHLIGAMASFWWTCITSCILIPIFIAWRIIDHCCQFMKTVYHKAQQICALPAKLIELWHAMIRKIKSFLEAPELNRQRLLHENPVRVSHARASAAGNTQEITENEKVLILMQKMRKLEETIFQESVDRRKAEGELFELKVNYQQKNAQLIKQRSECVENLNKINLLKAELNEKNETLQKNKKKIEQLEQEVLNNREKMMKLKAEKEQIINEKDQIVEEKQSSDKPDESSQAESSQNKAVEGEGMPETEEAHN